MDYADHDLELLLKNYHTNDKSKVGKEIEKEVMSRKLSLDDMAMINNAFFHFLPKQRRAKL